MAMGNPLRLVVEVEDSQHNHQMIHSMYRGTNGTAFRGHPAHTLILSNLIIRKADPGTLLVEYTFSERTTHAVAVEFGYLPGIAEAVEGELR